MPNFITMIMLCVGFNVLANASVIDASGNQQLIVFALQGGLGFALFYNGVIRLIRETVEVR